MASGRKMEQKSRQLGLLRRTSLSGLKRLGVIQYVELSCACDGISCQACRDINGTRVLLKDELRHPTLPVANCTNDLCRCCYSPVVE